MKETFYFSHDYNARTDSKIRNLIRKHKLLGYGIYWAIIEDLYQNANALPMDCEGIAFDLHTDEKTIESIICDFDLFIINDGFFGSLSVQRRLDERNAKSNKAREIAMKRWEKNANAMPTHSKGNAIKESIGEDSKVEDKKEEPPKGVAPKIFVPDFESYTITYRQGLKTWWDYKVEKKQKYKPTGWETFVKSAMEDFPDAVKFNEALKYSMSNNYSGLHSKSSKPQFVPPNTASMEGEDYMKND